MTRISHLVLILFTIALTSSAWAQSFKLPGLDEPEGFGDSRDQVRTKVVASQSRVAPGSDMVLAVVLDHNEGWHVWTNEGNRPEGAAIFDGAIYTQVTAELPDDSPVTLHLSHIQWPEPHMVTADVGEGPQKYAVFSDRAVIYVPLSVKPDAKPGRVSINLDVPFQACNDQTCLMPAFDHQLKATFEIVSDPAAAAPAGDAELFQAFDASVFARIHAGDAATGEQAAPSEATTQDTVAAGDHDASSAEQSAAEHQASVAAASAATSTGRPQFFGLTLPETDGAIGMLMLALLSMAGGFILNLTPCVLPIIPIKIMTISQHAGTPGRSLQLGLWMALGVVAFWMGIGLPVAFVSSTIDPSRVFGIWWVTLGIGALIGAMGLGIMGLFQIQLPAAVYAVNPKADTAWGSFVFGVMTAVLGLPCFGFVAGALLAGAATLPPLIIMLIFASLGVGMAAPYLILSARPNWVNRIPRTGPASELVKQVMGLLLLAAAAYFVGSGLIGLVSEQPYLARQLHWWAVTVLVAIASLWLVLRTFQISQRVAPRLAFTVVGVVLTAAALLYTLDSTEKARVTWEARKQAIADANGTSYVPGIWNDWSPEAVAKARADGRVVVLDFTAEWCLTCKALKAAVLNREPVKSELIADDVAAFTVDLTSRSAPGWEYLRSLGNKGIPMLAIFAPGDDTPWKSGAYSSEDVLAALEHARAKRVATNN